MTPTTQTRHLLKPIKKEEIELQVTQFLDSQFPSLVSLEKESQALSDLKELVNRTKAASDTHQSEFIEAKKSKVYHVQDTTSSISDFLNIAQEHSLSCHALADDLGTLTSELVSSYSQGRSATLLEDLELLHRSFNELVGVRDYLLVFANALRLSEEAVSQVEAWSSSLSVPETSTLEPCHLVGYRALQSLVSTVSQRLETTSEGSHENSTPLNLVSFLFKVRDQTWVSIKRIVSSQLLRALDSIGWPNAVDLTTMSTRIRFEVAFTNLLQLQVIGEDLHEDGGHLRNTGIYPIQILVVPISLRFKFHFEGKHDTNRIDKPEWYFTHVVNEVHKHRSFLETAVARLLSSTKYKQINAYREFILSLLPLLSRKLQQTIPSLLDHPALLAHTIYMCLAFDTDLREAGFTLEGTTAIVKRDSHYTKAGIWGGLTEDILENEEWFQSWLEGERRFANSQYIDIISDSNAWQIADSDHTVVDEAHNELRPTTSAYRLTALVEQITERYRPIPRFFFRTQFLIHVQLPILELYHSRISASLDAFESLSTSFVRVVPGALVHQVGHGKDDRNPINGIDGLDKLVRATVSASYVAMMLEKWNEDQFFLELWSEINSRVASRGRASSSWPTPSGLALAKTAITGSQGTIFQELVDQYRKLIQRAESIIVNHVCSEVELVGKLYFNSQNVSGEESLHFLPKPVTTLSAHLKLLAWSLPTVTFIPLYRLIVSRLADLFYQRRILSRGVGRLSFLEAAQIAEECLLWVQSCRMVLGPNVRHTDGPWKRLLDATKVLALSEDDFPVVALRIIKATPGDLESIQEDLDISNLDLDHLIDIVKMRQDCK